MKEWLAVAGWIVALKLLIQFLPKTFHMRKLLHILVGLSVVPLVVLIPHWYVAAIPLTMIFAANAHTNLRDIPRHSLLRRMYALLGFLAPLLLFLFLWRTGRTQIIVAAVLVMTFGDAAAAWIGRAYGKHRLKWNGKSIEGALANLLVSFTTLFLLSYQSVLSLAVAAAASILEFLLPGIWDNPAVLMSSSAILLVCASSL